MCEASVSLQPVYVTEKPPPWGGDGIANTADPWTIESRECP
jgi:hypothetical protein